MFLSGTRYCAAMMRALARSPLTSAVSRTCWLMGKARKDLRQREPPKPDHGDTHALLERIKLRNFARDVGRVVERRKAHLFALHRSSQFGRFAGRLGGRGLPD
jgi:hypothetical protein